MAKSSKVSGKNNSAMASTASRTSKAGSFIVSQPLSRSEIDWLKQQSKLVSGVSFLRSKVVASRSGKITHQRAFAVAKDQLFVEKREQGDYAVRRGGAERASAVLPTQREAIARARTLNPDQAPLVERVRNTEVGGRDKWRKA